MEILWRGTVAFPQNFHTRKLGEINGILRSDNFAANGITHLNYFQKLSKFWEQNLENFLIQV